MDYLDPMSSVPKKADKLNLSLPLSLASYAYALSYFLYCYMTFPFIQPVGLFSFIA